MSINREKANQKFKEEYEKLNERQKLAVDTIEGPVMVIAGPGTGKTQILAARIGKILLETDVIPENILCLTYTDAGAVAMRKRLLNFIGPDAYKVNIFTFHAFCNDIIQENLSLFEKNILDPISELERIELFKKLIDAFPKNHLLKRYRGDVYYEVGNLKNLFSLMKREGLTKEFINEKINDYIKSLPLRGEYVAKRATKEFKKGDVRTDKIEEETEKMEKLRTAVNEFDNFQQLMRKKDRYDFDDMINWVLKAFTENKQLLANYQERYQYILVDEYQDTSGTQNKLVELLINYWDRPNVFVVGDDDQSIFRFQGANVENMEAFMKIYSDLLTIVLENNYRSTQPILDISKSLIEKNDSRLIKTNPSLNLTKDLISSNKLVSHLTHAPVIREYESQRQEMVDIAMQVETLISSGVQPGRIAVIYKENKYGEELAKFISLKKMPVFSKRSVNLFELPLAQKIILILRYLAAEHDIPYGGDEMLFEILHFDFYKIPPIEIAKLSIEVAEKQFSANKTSIRRLLNEKANAPAKDLFDVSIPQSLKNTNKVFEQLIADVPNVTIQTLLENIVRTGGVLNYIMQSPEKIWLLQVLTALFDFVKEETRRNPFLTLKDLIAVIELMEKNDIPIPLVQISGSDKGVNLLTAHGSKGLEFEYVFFAGCSASFWEKKRMPFSGYKMPDTIFSSQAKSSEEEELRRLFYVALTRAEKYLFISYARFNNANKELEPSMFIAEILDKQDLPIEKRSINTETLMEFESLQFSETAPEIEKIEEDFISHIIEKFVLSVTALNNYLNCPLEFYFKNLIRIPSPKNEASEFGSSIHFALQKMYEKMKTDPQQQFPSKENVLQDFNWYMHRHRESFTREAFDRRIEYGFEVLANYYDKYINSWNKIAVAEINIRNVVIKGVPIKGKLDKLEFTGKDVNVVDYKTGDIEKALPKLRSPNDKEPNGGDYWRQAVFYKILIDNYKKDWRVISTEFDFIEPDKKKNYRKEKVIISAPDIETVTQQIVDTWQKIQNREFYTGCGKSDCHWCNFVKTNNMAVALHELNEEEPEEI
ncbi:MAG TPA: ATP-dependent DNA helicase [Puia sp.]|jgi:DNA helicase-2/ATP-dependent DNA helicase PcrA|nr:ATP-dependent DNA helicase [Puia sp.]